MTLWWMRWRIGVVICMLMRQGIAMIEVLNPIYFASPYEVIIEALRMSQQKTIYRDIGFTFYRFLISVLLTVGIGVPLWVLIGYFSRWYEYIESILDFLRSIPPILFYPLLLMALWAWDSARITTAIIWSTVLLILIIAKGVSQQPRLRRNYHMMQSKSVVAVMKDVIRFEALPYVLLWMRTVTSLCLIIIIVTEMLVGDSYGLWTRAQNVQITSNIPDLFVTIIIIWLIWVLCNKGLLLLEQKVIFWKV